MIILIIDKNNFTDIILLTVMLFQTRIHFFLCRILKSFVMKYSIWNILFGNWGSKTSHIAFWIPLKPYDTVAIKQTESLDIILPPQWSVNHHKLITGSIFVLNTRTRSRDSLKILESLPSWMCQRELVQKFFESYSFFWSLDSPSFHLLPLYENNVQIIHPKNMSTKRVV